MSCTAADRVTLAIPCRTDEPALARTVRAAVASLEGANDRACTRVEVLVCVNGPGAAGARAAVDTAALAADFGARLQVVDLDTAAHVGGAAPQADDRPAVILLLTARAGKAIAWNHLRQRATGAQAVFLDADVRFAAGAPVRLLAALAARPDAVLAGGKTICAARPTWFESVMAVPYRIDFPNLSPQMYAARVAALPPGMPEDLIEPERWLELVIGRERVVRDPAATVSVRLPGTLADFFRQRIRIEMGKVQIASDHPGLAARGAVQPRGRAAWRSLDAAGLVRLGAYLALRETAHAVAAWRFRRGRTAGVWRQPATTKQWDGA